MDDIIPSSATVRTVKSMVFGVFSPEEIKAMSVVKITNSSRYDEHGLPKEGGLLDTRMGVTDFGINCTTCGGDRISCPGHFGHMELAQPVLHNGFIPVILKILRAVCFHCGKLLVSAQSPNKGYEFKQAMKINNPMKRLAAVSRLCSGVSKCGTGDQLDEKNIDGFAAEGKLGEHATQHIGCGNQQPKYRRDIITIKAEFPEGVILQGAADKKQVLTPAKILEVFKKITPEDMLRMGFDPQHSRPTWFILTMLPVVPPAVRPSVMFDATAMSSDDLTYKLGDIFKVNSGLERLMQQGSPPHVVKEKADLLQYHVATLFDNEINGLKQAQQRSGKPLKSIRQRLVGKAGRVRGNLMGKRVDFSARSVIAGDPNLGIDYIGVPRSIAMTMTFPEVVTEHNIEKLKQLVVRGPDLHPGAKTVVRTDGRKMDLRAGTKKNSDLHLEPGYIVERHINDGDVIIFNRQPSLHKMSMMAHKIKVMPYSTFRLNLCCTSPYNADFDGDEMNMHVPQSMQTRAECLEIMIVPRQIVAPKNNAPCIAIVQDTLLGCFKFTQRDCFVPRWIVYNTLMHLENWDGEIPIPCILKPTPLWSGKQLFSMLLPKVNLTKKANDFPDEEAGVERKYYYELSSTDTYIRIERGLLIQGIVDKQTVGSKAGSLIHIIWHEFGPDATRRFLNECQRMVNYFLTHTSFSTGVCDAIVPLSTLKQIKDTIDVGKDGVHALIMQARRGDLQQQPGSTYLRTFENEVNKALNSAVEKIGKLVKSQLTLRNNINAMVSAGSKGSLINISQIMGCVGQQNVMGQRIAYGFTDRTLPHFRKYELGPASRGFVENSYLLGLTPQEFYFHASAGREGLIDTAVKTAETGYVQRRLVKAMEDVMVQYDGTVRNSQGYIVQFLYGEDGMDGTFIEKQHFPSAMMTNEQFAAAYEFDLSPGGDLDLTRVRETAFMTAETHERMMQSTTVHKALADEMHQLALDRKLLQEQILPLQGASFSSMMCAPVMLSRLIHNAQKQYSISASSRTDLDPETVIHAITNLLNKLIVIPGDDFISREAQTNACRLFAVLVRSTLASKRVMKTYRLSKDAFTWLLGEIESRFYQALIHPGEMVGPVAAQSIGEPATQMTLNTFHFAGVSSKNVTLGVPRLKELINVARNIKTPSLKIRLDEEHRRDTDQAMKVLNTLEYTTLGQLVDRTEIHYDPDPTRTVVAADQAFVGLYWRFPDENIVPENCSAWMLRIVLNTTRTQADKNLTPADIQRTIEDNFGNNALLVVAADTNSKDWVLQIRIYYEKGDIEDNQSGKLMRIEKHLLNMSLSGVKGISRVYRDEMDFEAWVDGVKEKSVEMVLATDGLEFLQAMCTPGVDFTTTTCNHITEVAEVLGIEAARLALLRELQTVISFGGTYVNYRHVAMLCDIMTFRGHLMSITRHGINRVESGPLMRCSFEETVEILLDAAVFAEQDLLLGVSENVMLGQLIHGGTGAFDLLLNTELLEEKCPETVMSDLGQLYGTEHLYQLNSQVPGTPMMASGKSPMPASPMAASPFSPMQGGFSPGPGGFSPVHDMASPAYGDGDDFSPVSPNFSPTSPSFSPTSPSFSPTSPSFSPTSPSFSPTSPSFSPTSPSFSPTSPSFSPTSPSFSPTSPSFSPTSPSFSPTSPSFSPTSPSFSPTSPSFSPTSPSFSPTSPSFSPTSPSFSPTSPSFSPTSPSFSPTSPSFSPTSPSFSPTSPSYSPDLAAHAASPSYSPTSPSYNPPDEE